MGFGKLPQPAFGGAWGRGSEDTALLHSACSGRRQCELDGERRQDVILRQEQQRSRCVHASQALRIDSVDVGQEDVMVVVDEESLVSQGLHCASTSSGCEDLIVTTLSTESFSKSGCRCAKN